MCCANVCNATCRHLPSITEQKFDLRFKRDPKIQHLPCYVKVPSSKGSVGDVVTKKICLKKGIFNFVHICMCRQTMSCTETKTSCRYRGHLLVSWLAGVVRARGYTQIYSFCQHQAVLIFFKDFYWIGFLLSTTIFFDRGFSFVFCFSQLHR